jgi:hypothetical protein
MSTGSSFCFRVDVARSNESLDLLFGLRWAVLLALAGWTWSQTAAAHQGCRAPHTAIVEVAVSGNSATSEETLLALLPRRPPGRYTPLELDEFERRLKNLGIFDQLAVECLDGALRIAVREKWTLVPELDFATGQTLEDSYALVGVTEYNLLGTGHQLSLNAYREQRGFGVTAAFAEHDYQRNRWALSSEISFGTETLRFGEAGEWQTTGLALELSMRSPPWIHEYFNYTAGLDVSSQTVHSARRAVPPPSSQVLQSFMGFSWDAYEWHDLVPAGLRAEIWLSIGGLFGVEPPLARHTAEFSLQAAVGLGWGAVLLSRLNAAVGTRGNVNYGFLLGSVDGVRGLEDSYYFNWAQAFSNLELRQSFELLRRWAVQGVLFVDAAAFEPMNEAGGRAAPVTALALGCGARVVPTWISSIVLRLDGSRVLAPEPAWFLQFGLNQYF